MKSETRIHQARLADDEFTAEARRLLASNGRWQKGDRRENPVAGCYFSSRLDPLSGRSGRPLNGLKAGMSYVDARGYPETTHESRAEGAGVMP
jgi:hypothetical protein